jgi:hypothetical protein
MRVTLVNNLLTVVTDVTKEVVKAGLKASFGSKNS